MAVKGFSGDQSHGHSDSGQSVLEFLLTLPLLVGITILLVRVNTVIQISIVDQQYAREHALFLTFNSPTYPIKRLVQSDFIPKGTSRMIIGVANNTAPRDGGAYFPEATTFRITRDPRTRGDEGAHKEPRLRSSVRVRNTVELCTQNNLIQIGGAYQPLNAQTLLENTTFNFCKSQYD